MMLATVMTLRSAFLQAHLHRAVNSATKIAADNCRCGKPLLCRYGNRTFPLRMYLIASPKVLDTLATKNDTEAPKLDRQIR
jgi:hypothetical protein